MPIFRVRLEDAESGEFRQVAVAADSKEEARAICEQQEAGHVQFFLSGEEIADLEKKEKDGSLRGRDKGLLFSHRQANPYKIVSVKED